MGRPVIASNVGGIPEIIEHGQNGYLVPPGDAAALASAIIRLIENARIRSSFSLKGRECVAARFSAQRMVEDTARLLERCAAMKTPG